MTETTTLSAISCGQAPALDMDQGNFFLRIVRVEHCDWFERLLDLRCCEMRSFDLVLLLDNDSACFFRIHTASDSMDSG